MKPGSNINPKVKKSKKIDPPNVMNRQMTSDIRQRKIELLAPAGSMEKLEIVLHYGADAVYLAGQQFSLRNFSANFSIPEIREAVAMTHDYHARAYIAVNIYARNADLHGIRKFLEQLSSIEIDGLIVADPALVELARRILPHVSLHLSTQANTTNAAAASFWQSQGIGRINLARELSLSEIRTIAHTCTGLEVEVFVHGAMCISYSGRCLLSNFLAQRPSNQGMCCQPCRFQYAVVEETRPGQFFAIGEDERGSYVFNSRDLCMIEHLPALIQSGITALKIEGRMKSIHYAATTVKIYREAIDRYYDAPFDYHVRPYWPEELNKVTSRGYCTGFYLDENQQTQPNYQAPVPSRHPLAAKVISTPAARHACVEVRNQIRTGNAVEIVQPKGPPIQDTIEGITDWDGNATDVAHPGTRATLRLSNTQCHPLDLIRLCMDDEARGTPQHA
jgi:putative protease